ncbi:hypothetical protein AVEN_166112-1 [Araneus ventricosus]|uniref:Uncharacterized protein n=1 Tax=Araneus ventricosus TaxID=182803 RepID=A0A4Y2WVY1_ARAVE|nr:hypothetical protein AVEN_119249-1 [Araneus ventricosus]GBO44373.1 hypothetical protein AVEN_166112-1 [Araneus ventricosus]
MEQERGTKTVLFPDIPAKYPDISPMDFCSVGPLKCTLSKHRHTTFCELREGVQEEWDKIPLPILQQALLSWKLRCRKIFKNKGDQTEH